jgi:hypothetical protein
MARRLQAFPGDKKGLRRYPWREWTDGSTWEIRQGDDYDVATENMRVNLHLKAEALGRKVRTRKVTGGAGLVFQFLESEEDKILGAALKENREGTEDTLRRLYEDAFEIYERARAEVNIERKDGRTQKYAAIRFRRQVEDGLRDERLPQAIARMVKKQTRGFGHLEKAGRADLMLETLVADPKRPYHSLFSKATVAAAEARLRGIGNGGS